MEQAQQPTTSDPARDRVPEQKRKRAPFFNVRPPLWLAIVAALAAFGASCAFGGGTVGAVCGFVAAVAAAVFAAFSCKRAVGKLVFGIVAACVCALVATVSWAQLARIEAAPARYRGVTVRCTIDGIPYATGDGYAFDASDIVVDGKKLSFDATVTVVTDETYWSAIDVGACVELTAADVGRLDPRSDGRLDGSVLSRPYAIEAEEQNATLDGRGGGPIDRIRYRLINALRARLSYAEAGLACAMLFGDKSLLPASVYDDFRLAGIAHSLAVSGLHVGFLLALLALIPQRGRRFLRIGGFCVTAAVLGLYAALCGFASGVVRAVVMGLLARFALLVGRRPDPWNDLGIAALVLLVADPSRVTNAGCAMSFFAAAGIFALAPPLSRLLQKIRCPRRIASVLAATIGASVMLMPLTASLFHTLSPWTLLENLAASPLVAVCFSVLFVCAALALVPPFEPVLTLLRFPLKAMRAFTAFCARLPGSDPVLFSFGAAAIAAYVCVFLCSELPLYRPRGLAIGMRIAAAAGLVVLAVCVNLPARVREPQACVAGTSRTVIAALATEDGTLAVGSGDRYSLAALEDALIDARIRKVDVLVVTHVASIDTERLARFADRFSVGALYVDYEKDASYAVVAGLKRAFTLTDPILVVGAFRFEAAADSGNLLIRYGAKTFLYAEEDFPLRERFDAVFSAAPVGPDLLIAKNLIATSFDEPEWTIRSQGRFTPV